jgi:hypothetical protein
MSAERKLLSTIREWRCELKLDGFPGNRPQVRAQVPTLVAQSERLHPPLSSRDKGHCRFTE